ncbi:MAG: hypothetical protein KC442_05810 [Thermomicrobiales bacterium]|nr:hypothetical protein [Thermomicrobiales bacterium]
MDGSRFDQVARALHALRTRRAAVATLGAALGAMALSARDSAGRKKHKHKKRKKTCAKTCRDGCCTSKKGRCVRPGQQSLSQCGTGGETCRSSGCRCSASLPCPEGQCCGSDGACGSCLVFETSTTHTGDLGGLAGADAICQGLAAGAGLPGSYLAWLSDDSGSPSTRFTRATVPYIRVDGEVVANSYGDLTDGSSLNRAINLTEEGTGGAISPNQVWTSTGDDGEQQVNPENCVAWTSGSAASTGDFGLKSSIAPSWTGSASQGCDNASRLYCFQQR